MTSPLALLVAALRDLPADLQDDAAGQIEDIPTDEQIDRANADAAAARAAGWPTSGLTEFEGF